MRLRLSCLIMLWRQWLRLSNLLGVPRHPTSRVVGSNSINLLRCSKKQSPRSWKTGTSALMKQTWQTTLNSAWKAVASTTDSEQASLRHPLAIEPQTKPSRDSTRHSSTSDSGWNHRWPQRQSNSWWEHSLALGQYLRQIGTQSGRVRGVNEGTNRQWQL